ncbi:hypothetical protein KI387_028714, partial [Taxus chinensis]
RMGGGLPRVRNMFFLNWFLERLQLLVKAQLGGVLRSWWGSGLIEAGIRRWGPCRACNTSSVV